MADFSQTRSEYLKVMMGERKNALTPYRPEQMNDLGDTSFDVASLSTEDINKALMGVANKQYPAVEAKNEESSEKPWWEQVGDFFNNIGTSITEGIFKAVDAVSDFTLGFAGGLFGGGWFGAQNGFTDWVANAMTDDRWISYATKAAKFNSPLALGYEAIKGNKNGFWTDWSYEGIKAQEDRDYQGMDWLRQGGSFVGQMIPSLLLAAATGGSSLGVQAGSQAGLGFARGLGEAQSRALSEGASFQSSAGYGALKGAISGALSGVLTYAGGTFASRSADSVISKAGAQIGDAVLQKTGSASLSAFANHATTFAIRVVGDAGEAAVLTAVEPAFQMIYNDDAWYNAYGTEENRQRYGEQIGKAALTAAAFSAVTNAVRDVAQVVRAGGRENYLEQYERSSNQRIAEREVLKSLGAAERKLAAEGTREWSQIQREMDTLQQEYETLKARGASDADLELFVGKNKEIIGEKVRAFSDKYGKVFTKMSAKIHPDVVGKSDNAALNEARNAAFQKFSSMSNKGAKEQLARLFEGKNGISGLISYTNDGEPVETVKENNALVAKPKTAEQVESVLAVVASKVENAPSIIILPLNGKEVRLDVSTINETQAENLATIEKTDFIENGKGAVVANIGDGKSLAITADRNEAQIIPTSQTEEWSKPVETKAEPSVVRQAANAKIGKVYSFAKSKAVVDAIYDAANEALDLDNVGGKTRIEDGKRSLAKTLFDTLNLGDEKQKADLLDVFRERLLDKNVKYELKNFYGDVLEEYEGTLKDFLNVLDADERQAFNSELDKLFADLKASGDESAMSKVVDAFSKKVEQITNKYHEVKAQTKLTGHIEKHRGKLVRRYYHGDVSDFAPGFDFDTQGYRVLIQPIHDFEMTAGKNSYTGSSVVKALGTFLEGYKMENYVKNDVPSAPLSEDVISVSELYNQGLRDLANALVDSIETNNKHVTEAGNVRYDALNSEQLSMLRMFQDTIEDMPNRLTKDRLKAVAQAKAAYSGVERYVGTFIKGQSVGAIRNFAQGFAERYSNPFDALLFEAGDNVLTRTITEKLYLSQAQRAGMIDDYQRKINDLKKGTGVTNRKLETKSNRFEDTAGNKIEMKYLEGVYRHLLSGEESNNVRYMEANTVHIKNDRNKIVHVAKFSYSNLKAIEDELRQNGLLEYSKGLHEIESKDLGDIYDEDTIRDTHIPNSNRIKDYTHVELDSNASKLGKATIKEGVARYGQQKDRVTKIPSGVHLVIRDGEDAIIGQVANQANIHFNDPVLKEINGMLGTKLDKSGTTLKEYLTEKNPGALKLIERAIYGAYGVNPNKESRLINFVGNGYVMTLIGANPSSIAKQPISIMWSNDISLASVLKFTIGANLNPTIWKNSSRLIKEIEKEFPALRLRGKKNEALLGNTASDQIGKVQKAIAKVAGFGLRVSDAWTVGHEAVGLLAMQARDLGYGEIGTEGNDEYVKYHYRAFYATQVSSDRITMSGARAGYYGGMGKLTSFMTGAVQGQIGYILRSAQQLVEYKGKTTEYYDKRVADAKEKEDAAKKRYEEAQDGLSKAQEEYEAERTKEAREKVAQAKENVKDAFDDYSDATGERSDAETSAKGFRHFKEMGGAKGVVGSRVATLLITAIALTLVGEINSRLKGQKEWSDADFGSIGRDFAINTVGWAPIVRDLVNAVKGYDLEIPEYAMFKQAYDLIGAIGGVMKNPTDNTTRSLLKKAVETFSAFMGLPVTNVWKYVYGITKTFSPATALKMKDVLYGASSTGLATSAKEYAERNDISTAADLYSSLYAVHKTGEIDREVAVELSKLVREGYNPIARNVPEYYANDDGERVDLSADQRAKFSDSYSKANEVVAKFIKTPSYKNLENEAKAKSIKKIYDLYYEFAKYKALGVDPESKLGKLLAFTGGDYDVAATIILIERNASLMDTKRLSKKEQAVRMVNGQPMTKAGKLLTLYLMGYGLSAENKEAVKRYLVSLGFTKKQAEEFAPSNKK